MGMFDEVRCDYPLPNRPEWADEVFQTKDTKCFMDMHHITVDGDLLLCERVEGKRMPLAPAPHWTGSMRLYTGHKDKGVKGDWWFEVVLLIRMGRVISADLVELKEGRPRRR